MPRIATTYEECIKFILKHRKDKVFQDFTAEQIFETVKRAAYRGAFCYVLDEEIGELVGIVTAEPYEDIKQLHITQILCTRRGVMREMLKQFETYYKGWTLTATRRGERVVYKDTQKLCKKICSLS